MFNIKEKVSNKSELLYIDLLAYIYQHGNKLTNELLKEMSKEFGVSTITLKKYIKKLKDNGVIVDDSISDEYISEVEKYLKGNSSKKAKKPAKEKKVDSILEPKILKKFPAVKVGGKNSKVKKYFGYILENMYSQFKHPGKIMSVMLTGEPGTGKTSMIRSLSKLLGLPLIVVEAPHITEEHIINIPYLVLVNNKEPKEKVAVLEQKSDNDVVLVHAESNLVTEIKHLRNKKLTDEQLLEMIKKDSTLYPIFLEYYHLIKEIRQHFDVILFLDEFYRIEDVRIKNSLRNILNGFIGYDRIPKGVYIIYATNLGDEGVDEIPLNHSFNEIEVDVPSKEDWFGYILGKYVKDADEEVRKKINLKPEVFKAFYEVLDDEDLSYTDMDNEVRISPRRWEQLLLFINANLPVKDEKEAMALLYNVKMNFTNYLTGATTDLYENKVKPVLIKLIKQTSGIEVEKELPAEEWRYALKQQIETKIKLGEFRQYVPTISGLPGIGKTVHMKTIADENNLIFVHVDVSNLTKDQVLGIPMMKKTGEIGPDGKPVVETTFEKPSLLYIIENAIQQEIEMRKKEGVPLPDGEYKYLILFDELSRTSPDVFNAIRKVLLEKKFNHQYSLPEGSIVVTALNPYDVGANELTMHTRDVLDIITGAPSWKKILKYLRDLDDSEIHEMNMMVFETLANNMKSDETIDGEPLYGEMKYFYWSPDGSSGIYISPRDMDSMIGEVDNGIKAMLFKKGIYSEYDDLKEIHDVLMGYTDEDYKNALEQSIMNGEMGEDEKQLRGIYEYGAEYDIEEEALFKIAILRKYYEKIESKISFELKKNEIGLKKKDAGIENFLRSIRSILLPSDVKSLKEAVLKQNKKLIENIMNNNEIISIYNPLFEKQSELIKDLDLKTAFDVFVNNPAAVLSDTTLYNFITSKSYIELSNEVSEAFNYYLENNKDIQEFKDGIKKLEEKVEEIVNYFDKISVFDQENNGIVGANIHLSEKEFLEILKKAGVTDEKELEIYAKLREIVLELTKLFGDKLTKIYSVPIGFYSLFGKAVINGDINGEILSVLYNLFVKLNLTNLVSFKTFEVNGKDINLKSFTKFIAENKKELFPKLKVPSILLNTSRLIVCAILSDNDKLRNYFKDLNIEKLTDINSGIVRIFDELFSEYNICEINDTSEKQKIVKELGFSDINPFGKGSKNCINILLYVYCFVIKNEGIGK
jgi:MoxR-like ATPase/biotin operon repressor